MANLLPEDNRSGLISEYRLRLATAGLALLAGVLIAATALLVPSFILTESRLQQKRTALSSAATTTSSTTTQESRNTLRRANQKLTLAATGTARSLQATDAVTLITETKPTGISVRRITIRYPDGQSGPTVDVSGVANTRSALLAYESRLTNSAQVQAVDLPIGTLASSENAEFSLAVTLQKL